MKKLVVLSALLFLLAACVNTTDVLHNDYNQGGTETDDNNYNQNGTETDNSTGASDVEIFECTPIEEWDGEWEIVSIHVDWPGYDNIEMLANSSTEVVRVEILNRRVEWIDMFAGIDSPPDMCTYELSTQSQVRILEVFRGDVQVGDILDVVQLGGELRGHRWICDGHIELTVGEEFILFLETLSGEYHQRLNRRWIVCPHISVYHVSGGRGGAMDAMDGSEELEHIRPDDSRMVIPFVITIDDLHSLSAAQY